MNKLQSGAPFCHEDFSNDGSGVKTKPPRVWQLKVGFCLQHPHGLRNVTGDPFLPPENARVGRVGHFSRTREKVKRVSLPPHPVKM